MKLILPALALLGGAALFRALASGAPASGQRSDGSDPPPPPPGPPPGRFVPAKHFGPGAAGRRVDWVVLHTTETECAPGVAAAVAGYFHTTDLPVSSHYIVGPEEVVACVREDDVAWGAPGANPTGLHVEMVGRARYRRDEWEEPHQALVLARSAALVADVCARHAVPIRAVDAAGLKAGERGITTHAAVSQAFKRSDHWDPGPGFDLDAFLRAVEAAGGVA